MVGIASMIVGLIIFVFAVSRETPKFIDEICDRCAGRGCTSCESRGVLTKRVGTNKPAGSLRILGILTFLFGSILKVVEISSYSWADPSYVSSFDKKLKDDMTYAERQRYESEKAAERLDNIERHHEEEYQRKKRELDRQSGR